MPSAVSLPADIRCSHAFLFHPFTCAQMGFARDQVLQALQMGHALLTSRKYAHYKQARQMALCYNLLLDASQASKLNGKHSLVFLAIGEDDLSLASPNAAFTEPYEPFLCSVLMLLPDRPCACAIPRHLHSVTTTRAGRLQQLLGAARQGGQ